MAAERLAVHPFGDAHGGEGGKPQVLLHVQFEAEDRKAGPEALGVAPVAGPGVLDALLGQQAQGLAHAEVHVHRCRVVIHAVAAPVLVEQRHIEVPVGHFALATHQLGLGPRTHREGAQAGRAAQALLAAAVGEVDLPRIQQKGHTTERGDGVKQQQAVVLAAELTDALHGLADAGGGFGVHHRQDGGLVGDQRGLEFRQAEGLTPGALDRHHVGPVAAGHVGEAQAEVAHHRHQHRVAGFNGVGQGGLHRGAAGAAHRNGEAVVGLPHVAQQLLHLTHQLDIQGIEVADRHPGQGLKHHRMGIGGAWSEQQTFRRSDGIQPEPMGVVDGSRDGEGSQGRKGQRGVGMEIRQWRHSRARRG